MVVLLSCKMVCDGVFWKEYYLSEKVKENYRAIVGRELDKQLSEGEKICVLKGLMAKMVFKKSNF